MAVPSIALATPSVAFAIPWTAPVNADSAFRAPNATRNAPPEVGASIARNAVGPVKTGDFVRHLTASANALQALRAIFASAAAPKALLA